MVKIKVKVPNGLIGEELYRRIVHQHMRYAGLIDISEFLPDEGKAIEFMIEVDSSWSKEVIARIKSYGDSAEVVEE